LRREESDLAQMELVVLTALILICSLAVSSDLSACDQSNAVDVMHVPIESANPATCFMQGQAFLAGTSIGRDLTDKERVKVVCVRGAMRAAGHSLPG
jgi:hypothetical protein